MAVDAIGLAGTGEAAVPRNASIGQEAFLRILLTQLRFQDPLKPVDNEQFVAQLAQFSALEINRQQSDKIDTLLALQASTQAVGLIGRSVEMRNADGSSVVGNVTAITFTTGEPRLTINSNGTSFVDVKPSDITLVR